ncbi:Hypothetical predicted protein [Lecanosticta acicola]|uniref:Cryptic loci regulator 2 N-terminal domain-containing protein n=1 Tax=Lecanosticta acicola TaxID=111012 RepID=A0AAI8Z931_9PEZI|nr:Hypothetical predicted protein [Lecanosticta acicola]
MSAPSRDANYTALKPQAPTPLLRSEPPMQVKFLPPPVYSDGIDAGCTFEGFIRDDAYFCAVMATYLLDQGAIPGPGPYRFARLPDGYSGYRRISGDESVQVDRVIAGHPSGMYFTTTADFVDHLAWLQIDREGMVNPTCPCAMCSGTPRAGEEHLIREADFLPVRTAQLVEEHFGESAAALQPPPSPGELWCDWCLTLHSFGTPCDTDNDKQITEEEMELARELGLLEDTLENS